MHEHACALDVPQKIVAKTRAFRRALDEAGDVREHKRAVMAGRHAEIGRERGEVVSRDLGFRRGEYGEDGGLAHRGEPDETDVRDGLQLQFHFVFVRFDAWLRKARRLARRGRELRIAAPAAPAVEDDAFLARLAHIREDGAALHVPHDGTDGNADHQRLSVLSRAEFGSAGFAVFGTVKTLVFKVQKRGHMRIGEEHNVSAAPAVPAVGSALLYVFFAVEGGVPVPAVAGLDDDARRIYELHDAP